MRCIRTRRVVLLMWSLITWTSKATGAVCQLNIQASGVQQGTYEAASLQCSGGNVTACINERLLNASIKGVQLSTACCTDKCLLTICGGTQVTFKDAAVFGTHEMTSLCISGTANVTITGNSTFSDNLAEDFDKYEGGAIQASEFSTVTIGGNTSLQHNNGMYGGAVYAKGNAVVVITDASSITNNTAESGGGVYLEGDATMTIEGHTRICDNSGHHGGGAYAGDQARLRVADTATICNNSASWIGGGLVAANTAIVDLYGNSRVIDNMALNGTGGGALGWFNGTITVAGNSSISRNIAGSGGGIGSWDGSVINLMGNSRVESNRAINGTGGGLIIQSASVLYVNGNSIIANNTCSETGAGISADGTADISIGASVRFINNTVVREVLRPNPRASPGESRDILVSEVSLTGADIRLVDSVRLVIAPGANIDRCNTSVLLKRSSCEVGEFPLMDACVCCQSGTYSLVLPGNRTQVCEPCPLHATCRADSIIPAQGYWQSTASSTQVHPCPIQEACGERGICREGFTGNLCGVCTTDSHNRTYGMTTPLKCRPCQKPGVQFGVYALISFVTVCIIALTVHATWRDNCLTRQHAHDVRATDMIKVFVHFLQYLVILGSVSAPWPDFMRVLFSISSIVFGAASGQAVSLDCWLMHYGPQDRLPLAIQRQLVYFMAPVAVLAAVVLLEVLWWAAWQAAKMVWPRSGWSAPELLLMRKLPVMVLVVVFFAYPSLLRASAGFFACLRIDLPNKGPYPVSKYAVRTHAWGYWVGHMNQPCFVGWHKAWAFSIGLIGVLVFCVGMPVALFLFLKRNKACCTDDAFCEHYAFLFRNYKPELVYWEAVWAVQTVALTMVAVFHFTIGAYYSVVLLQTIFIASAALQAGFKPYKLPTLHTLQLTATACLVFTATGTLTFFDFGSQPGTARGNLSALPGESCTALCQAHRAIGVLVLVVDAAFICWCLYQIVASTSNMPRWLMGLLPRTCRCRNFECRCLGMMQTGGLCGYINSWWPSFKPKPGTGPPSGQAANLDLQLCRAGAVQEQV